MVCANPGAQPYNISMNVHSRLFFYSGFALIDLAVAPCFALVRAE